MGHCLHQFLQQTDETSPFLSDANSCQNKPADLVFVQLNLVAAFGGFITILGTMMDGLGELEVELRAMR